MGLPCSCSEPHAAPLSVFCGQENPGEEPLHSFRDQTLRGPSWKEAPLLPCEFHGVWWGWGMLVKGVLLFFLRCIQSCFLLIFLASHSDNKEGTRSQCSLSPYCVQALLCLCSPHDSPGEGSYCPSLQSRRGARSTCSGGQVPEVELGSQTRLSLISHPGSFLRGPGLPGSQRPHGQRGPRSPGMVGKST